MNPAADVTPLRPQVRPAPKVAFLSESPADEAAVRVVVEGVLGEPVEPLRPALRARGWPSVSQVLPGVLWWLRRVPEAFGLVVVVDSDDSPLHRREHDGNETNHPDCRLCLLRRIVRRTLHTRDPRSAQRSAPLRLAIGLAVPAIEAWYLSGQPAGEAVTETAWHDGLASGRLPYTRRELKQRVYGTMRPALAAETVRAVAAMRRMRGDFRRLENDFAGGFGALLRDLKEWKNARGEGAES